MMTFWTDRTPRERTLLLGLAVTIAIWLGIVGAWQPLQAQRISLAAQIARYQSAAERLANPGLVAAPADARPIPVIITESAADFQLAIRRLQPAGEEVQIVLEDAPFEPVLLWIDVLTADHALQLRALELIRRPAPGVVAVTLTVSP